MYVETPTRADVPLTDDHVHVGVEGTYVDGTTTVGPVPPVGRRLGPEDPVSVGRQTSQSTRRS